jgi:hypothetical protein
VPADSGCAAGCFFNTVGPERLHSLLAQILMRSRQSLKPIRFEGELLPDWAQLLDLAASERRDLPEAIDEISGEGHAHFSRCFA